MKIIAIADLHSWANSELEILSTIDYDCCCLLGDIPSAAIEVIKKLIHKPIFGVLGNHDEMHTLEKCGIIDLNLKSVTVNGVTFAGFGCSHRYKLGDYPMLTQKESIAAAKFCPTADILISHDTGYHFMGLHDKAHCGLKGISRYIRRFHPKLNLCGHYHNARSIRRWHCNIYCVYRCALVDYPTNDVKTIF